MRRQSRFYDWRSQHRGKSQGIGSSVSDRQALGLGSAILAELSSACVWAVVLSATCVRRRPQLCSLGVSLSSLVVVSFLFPPSGLESLLLARKIKAPFCKTWKVWLEFLGNYWSRKRLSGGKECIQGESAQCGGEVATRNKAFNPRSGVISLILSEIEERGECELVCLPDPLCSSQRVDTL